MANTIRPVQGVDLEATHRLITTNVKGESLWERINAASVVILLENHDEVGLQPFNGRLIEHYWEKEDILLTEGSPQELTEAFLGSFKVTESKEPYAKPYLPSHILEGAQTWDLKGKALEEEMALNLRTAQLIEFASNIYPYLYLISSGSSFEELANARELFEHLDPVKGAEFFDSLKVMNPQQRFDVIQQKVQKVLEELREIQKEERAFLIKDMLRRNESLGMKTVVVSKNHRKTWVISGEAHAQYQSIEEMPAVDRLYEILRENRIGYVTLKYFKGEEGSLPFEYEHSVEGARQFEAFQEKQETYYFFSLKEGFEKSYPDQGALAEKYIFLSKFFDFEEASPPEALFYCQLILEKVSLWTFD
ncbi:MAG: hypothetical protein KDK96_04925 [Chlamydiia bacterium]|nr:hypothetical protein [Chlamydiia bacterium]